MEDAVALRASGTHFYGLLGTGTTIGDRDQEIAVGISTAEGQDGCGNPMFFSDGSMV